jgi:hypothetical protein
MWNWICCILQIPFYVRVKSFWAAPKLCRSDYWVYRELIINVVPLTWHESHRGFAVSLARTSSFWGVRYGQKYGSP